MTHTRAKRRRQARLKRAAVRKFQESQRRNYATALLRIFKSHPAVNFEDSDAPSERVWLRDAWREFRRDAQRRAWFTRPIDPLGNPFGSETA